MDIGVLDDGYVGGSYPPLPIESGQTATGIKAIDMPASSSLLSEPIIKDRARKTLGTMQQA